MHFKPRPLKWPPVFPIDKDLALWLPFNDRSGAVARDRSGKGNNGALTGCSWVAGDRGGALYLDGVNDYVTIADASSLRITAELTIAMKLKKTQAVDSDICFKGYGAGTISYGFFGRSVGKVQFYVWNAGGGSQAVTSNSVSDGDIHSIVGVYSVANDLHRIYQNGVSVESQSNIGAINSVTYAMVIGRTLYAANQLAATIYDLHVCARAWTAAEAKRYHEAELLLARY